MFTELGRMQSIVGQGNMIVDRLLWETNTIIISARKPDTSEEFTLKFYDVISAEIRTGPYLNFYIVGLQIADISNFQWEGIKFQVFSEDDETYLFFYCKSLEAFIGYSSL